MRGYSGKIFHNSDIIAVEHRYLEYHQARMIFTLSTSISHLSYVRCGKKMAQCHLGSNLHSSQSR